MKTLFDLLLLSAGGLFLAYYVRRRRIQRELAGAAGVFSGGRLAGLFRGSVLCLAAGLGLLSIDRHLAPSGRAGGEERPRPIHYFVDCSRSMLAQGRFAEAKEAARRIHQAFSRHPSALAGYADNCFLYTPPTTDTAVWEENLRSLKVDSPLLVPGSNLDAVLAAAEFLAPPPGEPRPLVIVLTDGEMHPPPRRDLWKGRSYPLLAFLFGTPGRPQTIPWKGGLLRDPDTGGPALTTTSAGQLKGLIALSGAPGEAVPARSPEQMLSTAGRLLAGRRPVPAPGRRLLLPAAALLLLLALRLPGIYRITPAAVLPALLALLLPAGQATSGDAPARDYPYWLEQMRRHPGNEAVARELEKAWIDRHTPKPQRNAPPTPTKDRRPTEKSDRPGQTPAPARNQTDDSEKDGRPDSTRPRRKKDAPRRIHWNDLQERQIHTYPDGHPGKSW